MKIGNYSLSFDIEGKLSDKKSKLPHSLVSFELFEQEIQELGIYQYSIAILYNRWGIYSSRCAWWMFKVMRFDKVYILNGGLPAWKDAKFSLANMHTESTRKGDFKTNFRESWYTYKEYISDNYEKDTIQIFDAKSKGRFTGKVPEPRQGLRSGHIRYSNNIPFEEVLKGNFYSDKETIANIFPD